MDQVPALHLEYLQLQNKTGRHLQYLETPTPLNPKVAPFVFNDYLKAVQAKHRLADRY